MATPKRPGGTPSNTMNQSSPAPRSVPSPVSTRPPAGKTPVNHPTTGSTGSKTLASTPMVQNLSQTGNTSSPSANMLSFGTPSGLGIESATPAGLNLATPGLGGINMVPTMSDLGIPSNIGKRNEDEERRAKMRRILKSIGRPKGRVSEEGIARVGRRVGFQNDIDAEKLTNEEKERKVGNRLIVTAGNSVLVTVDLKNQTPRSVKVEFNPPNSTLDEQGILAGKVLLDDLKAPSGVALDATLDRFASNLERLAKMDRFSAGGINCFDALSGVYTSLCRLYDQEIITAKALLGDSPADAEVTCRRSGKPTMHARGKLGLELVYWRENNLSGPNTEANDTRMDIDGDERMANETASKDNSNDIFALRIEAEASPARLYPSLRVADTWLPEPLELPSGEPGEGIPWQDPPPTLLPSDSSQMTDNPVQKLPDLRFVAKLDPPLLVPYQTAANIFNAVGAQTPQPLIVPPPYAAMLLDIPTLANAQSSEDAFVRKCERSVLSYQNGEETTVKHCYVLTCAKPHYADSGFKIDEIPFSHPRQLVELLPTLRQWASAGSLLKTTLGGPNSSRADQLNATNATPSGLPSTENMSLGVLMSTAEPVPNGGIPINMSFATIPIPTLEITFPTGKAGQVSNVSVQILHNADVSVVSQDIIAFGGTKNSEADQKLAKALDVCSDLGVWIEWMRMKRA